VGGREQYGVFVLEFGPGVFTRTEDDGRAAVSRDVVALLEGMAREAGVTELWLDG
jgi:hypothetical protein